MCDNLTIVPWYNTAEWLNVYKGIYSENSDKLAALNLLLTWKARCPFLPAGVESTLSLLQVHMQDKNRSNDIADEQVMRLAYSSAIMRFVNHMLDSEIAKGISLYQAAKSLGVPDWIIDLRHDTAHSNNLPSITLLRNACKICLNWLQINYWDKHKQFMKDYVSGQEDTLSHDSNRIAALINFFSCVSICKHAKIKKLTDIPDYDMRQSIVTDARDLFGDLTDFSDIKTIYVSNLINLAMTHGKKYLTGKDISNVVNKTLLGEDSLFLSLELVDLLSKKQFNSKQKLNLSYVQCFESLLKFLHKNELILEFVLALIAYTQNTDCSRKALLAALWVLEIMKAFKTLKVFLDKAKKSSSVGFGSENRKNLMMMYHHWFPNENMNGIILDLSNPVPDKLTDIQFIQPIITAYNPYLTYFINDLLLLVEPKLPRQVSEKICHLAKLISAPESYPIQLQSKIYTLDDLNMEDIHFNNDSELNEVENIDEQVESIPCGIWKIASKKYNWSSCPIGQLPSECKE